MDVLEKILTEFDGALDNIAHHIAPFLNISLSSVSSQLSSIENATLHHSLSVLILALGSTYLRIGGIDVRNHTEISNEFATLKRLNERINATRQLLIEKERKEQEIQKNKNNGNDDDKDSKNSSVSSSSSDDDSSTDSSEEESERNPNVRSTTGPSSLKVQSTSTSPTSTKNTSIIASLSTTQSRTDGKGGTKRKYDGTETNNSSSTVNTPSLPSLVSSIASSDTGRRPSSARTTTGNNSITTSSSSSTASKRIISSTPQPQLDHLNWRKELEQSSKRKR